MVFAYKTLKSLMNGPHEGLLELVAEGQRCYLQSMPRFKGEITKVIKSRGREKMKIQFSYQDAGIDNEIIEDYDKFVVELPIEEQDINQNFNTPSNQPDFQKVVSKASMKLQKTEEKATKAAAVAKEREEEKLRQEREKKEKEEKQKKERMNEEERRKRESKQTEEKEALERLQTEQATQRMKEQKAKEERKLQDEVWAKLQASVRSHLKKKAFQESKALRALAKSTAKALQIEEIDEASNRLENMKMDSKSFRDIKKGDNVITTYPTKSFLDAKRELEEKEYNATFQSLVKTDFSVNPKKAIAFFFALALTSRFVTSTIGHAARDFVRLAHVKKYLNGAAIRTVANDTKTDPESHVQVDFCHPKCVSELVKVFGDEIGKESIAAVVVDYMNFPISYMRDRIHIGLIDNICDMVVEGLCKSSFFFEIQFYSEMKEMIQNHSRAKELFEYTEIPLSDADTCILYRATSDADSMLEKLGIKYRNENSLRVQRTYDQPAFIRLTLRSTNVDSPDASRISHSTHSSNEESTRRNNSSTIDLTNLPSSPITEHIDGPRVSISEFKDRVSREFDKHIKGKGVSWQTANEFYHVIFGWGVDEKTPLNASEYGHLHEMQSSDKELLNKTLTSEFLICLQGLLDQELFPIISSSDPTRGGSIGGVFCSLDKGDMEELLFAVQNKRKHLVNMIKIAEKEHEELKQQNCNKDLIAATKSNTSSSSAFLEEKTLTECNGKCMGLCSFHPCLFLNGGVLSEPTQESISRHNRIMNGFPKTPENNVKVVNGQPFLSVKADAIYGKSSHPMYWINIKHSQILWKDDGVSSVQAMTSTGARSCIIKSFPIMCNLGYRHKVTKETYLFVVLLRMNGGEPAAITVRYDVNGVWNYEYHSNENSMKSLIAILDPDCNYIPTESMMTGFVDKLLSSELNDKLPNLPMLMEVIPTIDDLTKIRRLKLDISAKSKIGGSNVSSDLKRMLSGPVHFMKKNMIGVWVINQEAFKLHKLVDFHDPSTASKQNFVYVNSPEVTYDYSNPIDNQVDDGDAQMNDSSSSTVSSTAVVSERPGTGESFEEESGISETMKGRGSTKRKSTTSLSKGATRSNKSSLPTVGGMMKELNAVAKSVVVGNGVLQVSKELPPAQKKSKVENNKEGNKRGRPIASTSADHTNEEANQMQRQFDLLKERAEQDMKRAEQDMKKLITAEQSKYKRDLIEIRKEHEQNLKAQQSMYNEKLSQMETLLLSHQDNQYKQQEPLFAKEQSDSFETQQIQDNFSRHDRSSNVRRTHVQHQTSVHAGTPLSHVSHVFQHHNPLQHNLTSNSQQPNNQQHQQIPVTTEPHALSMTRQTHMQHQSSVHAGTPVSHVFQQYNPLQHNLTSNSHQPITQQQPPAPVPREPHASFVPQYNHTSNGQPTSVKQQYQVPDPALPYNNSLMPQHNLNLSSNGQPTSVQQQYQVPDPALQYAPYSFQHSIQQCPIQHLHQQPLNALPLPPNIPTLHQLHASQYQQLPTHLGSHNHQFPPLPPPYPPHLQQSTFSLGNSCYNHHNTAYNFSNPQLGFQTRPQPNRQSYYQHENTSSASIRRERRHTNLLLQTMNHTAGLIHSSQAMPAFTSAMISRLQGSSGEVDEYSALNSNDNYDR